MRSITRMYTNAVATLLLPNENKRTRQCEKKIAEKSNDNTMRCTFVQINLKAKTQ